MGIFRTEPRILKLCFAPRTDSWTIRYICRKAQVSMYLYAEKMICLNPLHNNRKGDNQIILYNAQLKLKLVEEGVLERLSQIWVFLAARVCVSCNWCRIGGDFLCLDNERSSPEIISHFLDLGSNFDRRGGEVRSWPAQEYPERLQNILILYPEDYPERLNFAKKIHT